MWFLFWFVFFYSFVCVRVCVLPTCRSSKSFVTTRHGGALLAQYVMTGEIPPQNCTAELQKKKRYSHAYHQLSLDAWYPQTYNMIDTELRTCKETTIIGYHVSL